MEKTSTNLEENVASALCYVLTWVTGLIFILIEKENKTVRFHAFQSLITFIGLFVIAFIISALSWFIPFLWMLSYLIGILGFILWIILIIKAYQGQKFKLPIIGDMAEKQVK